MPVELVVELSRLRFEIVDELTEARGEKKCPFCAEIIKQDARKCRHCSEILDRELAVLKEHVAAKLLEQQRAAQAQGLEAALCDELLARHPFEVPPRLVAHQTERLTRDFKVRLLLSGVPEEELDGRVTQFAEQLRTSAARHVKLGFILERIAAQESVTVTQDEPVKRLWQLAQRWKKDPAQVRQVFDAQGLWPSVVSAIRQEKTMTVLLSAASITEEGPHE